MATWRWSDARGKRDQAWNHFLQSYCKGKLKRVWSSWHSSFGIQNIRYKDGCKKGCGKAESKAYEKSQGSRNSVLCLFSFLHLAVNMEGEVSMLALAKMLILYYQKYFTFKKSLSCFSFLSHIKGLVRDWLGNFILY